MTKKKVPTTTKLTGRANAITRGQGNKFGLRKQSVPASVKPILPVSGPKPVPVAVGGKTVNTQMTPFTAATGTAAAGTRPEGMNAPILPIIKAGLTTRESGRAADLAAKWQKARTKVRKPLSTTKQAAAKRDALKLTGRANALTRGRGKKLGLRKS
jgi:hypothetical protein